MVGTEFIRLERVREAMRLVGEVREIGTWTDAGRTHLLEGVMRVVGCAIGGAVLDTKYAEGATNGIAAATLAGFGPNIMDVFVAHQTYGSAINPFHSVVLRRIDELQGQVFSAHDTELVERKVWDGSRWINDYVRPAHVDHFLCTMRVIDRTTGAGCGFMRAARDRPFSDEDREVLHLIHLGVGPVYDAFSPRRRLSPRLRDTLDALLTGATDKEIAAQLRLSPHTVRQYVKALFKAYRVTGRGQLIARATRSS